MEETKTCYYHGDVYLLSMEAGFRRGGANTLRKVTWIFKGHVNKIYNFSFIWIDFFFTFAEPLKYLDAQRNEAIDEQKCRLSGGVKSPEFESYYEISIFEILPHAIWGGSWLREQNIARDSTNFSCQRWTYQLFCRSGKRSWQSYPACQFVWTDAS